MWRVDFFVFSGDEETSNGQKLQIFGVEISDFLKTFLEYPNGMVECFSFKFHEVRQLYDPLNY